MIAIILFTFFVSMIVSIMLTYVFLNNKTVKELNTNHQANQMIHIQALYESLNNTAFSEQDKIRFAKLYLKTFNNIDHKQFYNFAKQI